MRIDKHGKFHIQQGFFFAVVFGVMFALSLATPLIADDFNYAFGYANDSRISSLRDIWSSMEWHRRLLNGRVFSHGWLSLVLMYPRWVYAGLNAAVAILFSWTTMGFFQDQGIARPVLAAACVWMLLWICMPGFGQVFFWTAGACNYFWGIALAWFLIWRVTGLKQRAKQYALRTVLLLLFAFVAGAWSEHISFAMLVILFLMLLWGWIQSRRLLPSEAMAFLSACVGYLYLMLAPGSKLFQRLHDAGDPTEEGNLTHLLRALPEGWLPAGLAITGLLAVMIVILIRRKEIFRLWLALSFGIAVVCSIITLFFSVRAWRQDSIFGIISSSQVGFLAVLSLFSAALFQALKGNEKERALQALILAFGGLCGVALFVFGEYFPIRGFCAPVTMLVLSVVLLASPKEEDERCVTTTGVIAFVLLVSCFIVCFYVGVKDIFCVRQQASSRETAFMSAAGGDKIVVVTPYSYRSKYTAQYGNPDLGPDEDWPNGVVADYYGVNRILVQQAQGYKDMFDSMDRE